MKKMIPMLIAGAVALLFCGIAFADDMEMGGMHKEGKMTMEQKMMKKQADRIEMLNKDLMLTPDQKDKVSTIIKANGEQKKALMIKMEADEKAIHDTENGQIKALLTPDQQAKFDQMMMKHKAKMEKKMGEKKGM